MQNPLLEWIISDSKLNNLLEKIDSENVSENEKAKIAFDKLSDMYKLPKYPDDIEDSNSMYEVLGKIKFSSNKIEELKSNVLLAAYLIKNKLEPDISDELENHIGNGELLGFGYKGDDVNVVMIPIKKGESWFEKGCTYFTKEV